MPWSIWSPSCRSTGRQRFDAVNAFGARAVAEAARGAGLKRVIHMSAIGADPDSPSHPGAHQGAGEAAVFETLPDSVVFRPSIAFGQEDHFFNRFAALSRVTPALPLFGGGHTRFQPVFVGDVAQAVADAVEGKAKPGTTYELGGPEVKTFRECLETMLAAIDRRRLLVPVPWSLASAGASVLQLWPWQPLLTVDQVQQLKIDNVVSEAAQAEGRTFAAFGIAPDSLAAILPSYLYRFRPRGEFERHRTA